MITLAKLLTSEKREIDRIMVDKIIRKFLPLGYPGDCKTGILPVIARWSGLCETPAHEAVNENGDENGSRVP